MQGSCEPMSDFFYHDAVSQVSRESHILLCQMAVTKLVLDMATCTFKSII